MQSSIYKSTLLIKEYDQKKEKRPITKCSSNKGFSDNSGILPRSNFGVV